MSSSGEATWTYEEVDDGPFGTGHDLTFHCYHFSRSLQAGRPKSRRHVKAEDCSCPEPPEGICDPTYSYTIDFWEWEDEEDEEWKRSHPDFNPERVGVFIPSDAQARIRVPPSFMNDLWDGALAGNDGLRLIHLKVKQQRDRPRRGATQEKVFWSVIDVSLEEMGANPVIVELQRIQAQLKWLKPVLGIIVVAIGVLIALWIAHLWR
jgi:hypothetical protein